MKTKWFALIFSMLAFSMFDPEMVYGVKWVVTPDYVYFTGDEIVYIKNITTPTDTTWKKYLGVDGWERALYTSDRNPYSGEWRFHRYEGDITFSLHRDDIELRFLVNDSILVVIAPIIYKIVSNEVVFSLGRDWTIEYFGDPATATYLSPLSVKTGDGSFPCEDAMSFWLVLRKKNSSIIVGERYIDIFPPPITKEKISSPTTLSLVQNYPNPFNPATTVRYSVPHTSRVSLTIYNIRGQSVAVLQDGEQSPGEYAKNWVASKHPSGTYIAELVVSPIWDRTGNVNLPDMLIRRQVIKMQLLK